MLKINYITLLFILIVFCEFIAIIIFNITALRKYSKGLNVQVVNPPSKVCSYSDIPSLDKTNICKSNNSAFFYISGQLKYTLSTTPKFYLSVCNQLCGGSTTKSGQCSVTGFNECVDQLQPQKGCKNSSVPLVYSDDNNTRTLYYADKVMLASSSC